MHKEREDVVIGKKVVWRDGSFVSRYGDRLVYSVAEPRRAKATVLMLPGFTSKRLNSTNTQVAEHLYRSRCRCVALDPSGHGDSEGKIENQSVVRARDEILDAISHLDDKYGSASPFGVLGNSFSGNAAILAAGLTDRVRVLALKSPVTDYVTMRRDQLGAARMSQWARDGAITLPDGTRSNYSFITDAESVSTLGVLQRLKIPVLAIQGSRDEQIPERSRIELQETMRKVGKDYVLIEGGDHNLGDPFFKKTANLLREYLVSHLL